MTEINKKRLIKKILELKVKVPPYPKSSKGKTITKEFADKCLNYIGNYFYNEALKDVIKLIK